MRRNVINASAVWVTSAIPAVIDGVAVLRIVHVPTVAGWLKVAGVVIGILHRLEVGSSVGDADKGS